MDQQDAPVVPLDVAQHVLWHFGDTGLGLQPGSFVTHLLRTIEVADRSNRARLRDGFENYVFAFEMVQQKVWGLDWLRSRVKRALAPADGLDMAEAES